MKKFWWFLGFLGLAIILFGSLMPSDPGPPPIPNMDKILHFSGYAIATYYFQQLTRNQKAILIFILIFFYSGVIELLQDQLPSRQMSLWDLVANGLGGLFGSVLSLKYLKNLLFKMDHSLSALLSR